MDEKILIEQLKNGNQFAFRYLVDNNQQVIRNLCLSIVLDPFIADELAQDVFVEVFVSIYKFRADSKLSTWMYRLAVNKSLNYIRSQKKHKVLKRIESFIFNDDEFPEYQISDDPSQNALNQIIKTEDELDMENALRSLPENQRLTFSLHKIDDMAYKDIAQLTGLSLSAVESLIYRAKINLQKKLTNRYKQ